MHFNICLQRITNMTICILSVVLCGGFISQAYAQGVPSDLIELSMDDLFQAEISSSDSLVQQDSQHGDKWNFSYNYRQLKFDGYRDGTTNLSNADVLFEPALGDTRTDENFPVLPDIIVQEVHAFIATYSLSDKTAVNVVVPYVKQSTDHFSIVPGFAEFNITSQGVGDVAVTGSFQLSKSGDEIWGASAGLSIPTGSIDEQGDTPRAPGDQQLPYSMQLGSGTYDIPASASYTKMAEEMNWGAQLTGKLRVGDNDRNYTLGNRLAISSWVKFKTISWVEPSVKFAYKYWGKIDGADTEIQVPGAFPFPAAVTNPDLFGGKQADLFLGAKFPILSAGQYISVEISKPVYQDLNGPQSKEVYGFSTSFNFTF